MAVLDFEIDPTGTLFSGGVGIQSYNRTLNQYVPFQIYSSKLILNGGNVGIGTSPDHKLHVSGNTFLNGSVGVGIAPSSSYLFYVNGGILKIGNGTSPNDRNANVINIGDGDYIRIGEWEADDLLSFKASRYNFTNGNVGIGVVNPTEKLDVAGVIRAHRVKVCLNQGCDFVFDEDYKLLSLKELRNFIKTNKHLPDVAPAAVMEAEGIELSEMNALLLRKVEELTLYIIDLEKRLTELETKKNDK